MADYELHADYDRSGRLDASSSEHGRRGAAPGAVVVANVDADRRQLPATVSPGPRIILDRDQPVVLANDDEAMPLRIVVNNASAPPGSRFFLRPIGFARIRSSLWDASGRILPTDLSRRPDIPVQVPASPGTLDLMLTTNTVAGSPYGHATVVDARFSLDQQDESALRLQLVSVSPAGIETIHDEGRFTIAPFVVLDNASTALRVYVCDLPENVPSVTELEAALRALRVPLVKVPPAVANGDSWLQDQFQHALVQGASGWRQVLLHMPRLRSDSSSGSSTGNLSTFVMSHFPSHDLGVVEDLWARTLDFSDAQGNRRHLRFRDCDQLAVAMDQVFVAAETVIDYVKRLDRTFRPAAPSVDPTRKPTWSEILAWLPWLVDELGRKMRGVSGRGPEWEATARRLRDDARARVNAVRTRFPAGASPGTVQLPAGNAQVGVTLTEADRLHVRLSQMRHSSNYGGNVESSPPTHDALLGKLVIGNTVVDDEHDFMDPDLLRLLFKQRKQPVVQLDSSWLSVGHVDEFIAFAPDRRGGGSSFAILRASSELALRLVEEAHAQYRAGLPTHHAHHGQVLPLGGGARLTTGGTSPVTRMFRGKVWSHSHPAATEGAVPQVVEPPLVYQDVAQAMNGGDPTDPMSGGVNIHDIRYWPGEGPERRYPADITVREVMWGERDLDSQSTNRFIETQFLEPAEDVLRDAFPRARVLPLPVLFDRVRSTREWSYATSAFATSAFSPDVVNLQVVNGTLLIPRPYGPRMLLADAVAVITAATDETDVPESLVRRIDAAFVRRHRLQTGVYWLHRQDPVDRPISRSGLVRRIYAGLQTEAQVIAQFEDSFPGASAAVLRQKIVVPNRRHFDGRGMLRDGWRRFEIAESTVDLFETFVHAVADEVGAPVAWVDSWYYHVHHGAIHCGTNVLRMPPRVAGLPNVWDIPDVDHRTRTLDFEPDEVLVPAPR